MINKILLVNPPYENVGVKESVSNVSVSLSLAMLGAIAKKLSKDVKIIDLNLMQNWEDSLVDNLIDFCPDLVGITFTTPLIKIADRIAKKSKKILGNRLIVIVVRPNK